MLLKSIPVKVNDIDEKQGIVDLYFSAFGIVDAAKDIVVPGAFKKTFTEQGPSGRNRIKHLYQHEPFYIVGKPVELKEDAYGARVTSKISKTTWGNDVLTLYADGVITEHSFGYDIIASEMDGAGNQLLKELLCYEYSSVTWGCNMFTPTNSVKSAVPPDLAHVAAQMARIQKVLHSGTLQNEEVCEALEMQLKAWLPVIQEAAAPEPEREHIDVTPDPVAPPAGGKGDESMLTKALGKPLPNLMAEIANMEKMRTLNETFWRINDALSSALWTIREDKEADAATKQAAATLALDQFKSLMLNWFTQFLAVQFGSAAVPDELSAEQAEILFKAGRVLSAANRTALETAMQAMQGAMSAMQSMLDASKPDEESTSDDGNKEADAPGEEPTLTADELKRLSDALTKFTKSLKGD